MLDPRPAVELLELDEKGRLQNLRAYLLQKQRRRFRGPARCQQIVDQQHTAAGFDRIGVNGDGGAAVFQLVTLFVGGEGQLAFLAHRDKARLQLQSRRRREDETARV